MKKFLTSAIAAVVAVLSTAGPALAYDPPPSVPEPGTLILLGAGLIGLVAVGRKHLKK